MNIPHPAHCAKEVAGCYFLDADDADDADFNYLFASSALSASKK